MKHIKKIAFTLCAALGLAAPTIQAKVVDISVLQSPDGKRQAYFVGDMHAGAYFKGQKPYEWIDRAELLHAFRQFNPQTTAFLVEDMMPKGGGQYETLLGGFATKLGKKFSHTKNIETRAEYQKRLFFMALAWKYPLFGKLFHSVLPDLRVKAFAQDLNALREKVRKNAPLTTQIFLTLQDYVCHPRLDQNDDRDMQDVAPSLFFACNTSETFTSRYLLYTFALASQSIDYEAVNHINHLEKTQPQVEDIVMIAGKNHTNRVQKILVQKGWKPVPDSDLLSPEDAENLNTFRSHYRKTESIFTSEKQVQEVADKHPLMPRPAFKMLQPRKPIHTPINGASIMRYIYKAIRLYR